MFTMYPSRTGKIRLASQTRAQVCCFRIQRTRLTCEEKELPAQNVLSGTQLVCPLSQLAMVSVITRCHRVTFRDKTHIVPSRMHNVIHDVLLYNVYTLYKMYCVQGIPVIRLKSINRGGASYMRLVNLRGKHILMRKVILVSDTRRFAP